MSVSLMLSEIDTKEDIEIFQTILSKVADGHIVGTLRQAITAGNGYNYNDLQQEVARQHCIIQVTDEYCYVTFHSLLKMDAEKFKAIQRLTLNRSTYCFQKGLANDYVYTIDIICNELEKGHSYCVTGVQPVFMSSDGDKDLTIVFKNANIRFQVAEVTTYDTEYIQSLRDESGDTIHGNFDNYGDDTVTSEPKDFTGSGKFTEDEVNVEDGSDFVNTDRYTTGMQF